MHKLEGKGEITVITYRKIGYLSPEDAAWFLQQWRETLPLPGWVPLQVAAKQAGVRPEALSNWAKRNTVELRFYRHPEHLHLVHFLEDKHARRYIEKHDPRRGYVQRQFLEAA